MSGEKLTKHHNNPEQVDQATTNEAWSDQPEQTKANEAELPQTVESHEALEQQKERQRRIGNIAVVAADPEADPLAVLNELLPVDRSVGDAAKYDERAELYKSLENDPEWYWNRHERPEGSPPLREGELMWRISQTAALRARRALGLKSYRQAEKLRRRDPDKYREYQQHAEEEVYEIARRTREQFDARSKTRQELEAGEITKEALKGIEYDPMTAVIVDRDKISSERAWHEARKRLEHEQELDYWRDMKENDERWRYRLPRLRQIGAKLWRGGAARNLYEQKYRAEIREQYGHIQQLEAVDENGQLYSPDEVREKVATNARYALIMRLGQKNESFVYHNAGEKRTLLSAENDPDGAYRAMLNTLRKFAAKDENGQWEMSVDELDDALWRIRARQYDIKNTNGKYSREELERKFDILDNYEAVAIYVRSAVEHGEALDDVLQRFKMYRAEAAGEARTETRRTKLDKIAEKMQKYKYGRMLTAVTVGASSMVSTAAEFLLKQGSNILPILGPAGLGAAMAAMETGNDFAEKVMLGHYNQATSGADNANKHGSKESKEDVNSLESRPTAVYETAWSRRLIQDMERVIKTDDRDKMRGVLDDVLIRQMVSDIERVDLISYTNPELIESERLAMTVSLTKLQQRYSELVKQTQPDFDIDLYRIRLESVIKKMHEYNIDAKVDESNKSNHSDKSDYTPERVIEECGGLGATSWAESMPVDMLTEMYDHMRKVNLINRKMRRHEMKGTAIKTGVISATFSTVLQEALAMFNNPDTRGLIESIMGQDTDAKSTTLITGVWESLQDWFRRNTEVASDMVDKAIDSSAMNPAGLIAQIAPAVQVETNLMGRVKAFIIEKVWPFVKDRLADKAQDVAESTTDRVTEELNDQIDAYRDSRHAEAVNEAMDRANGIITDYIAKYKDGLHDVRRVLGEVGQDEEKSINLGWPFRWAIATHADKFMGDLDNQIEELRKSYQSTASSIPLDDMAEAIEVRALGNVLRQYGL